jgi:hypothetical protein
MQHEQIGWAKSTAVDYAYLKAQAAISKQRGGRRGQDRSDAWVVIHVDASLCCRSLVVSGSRSCCSQCQGTTQKLNAWRGGTRSE